jgi:hypothetical protein
LGVTAKREWMAVAFRLMTFFIIIFFPFLVCGTDFVDLMNAYFNVITYTDLSSFWFFLFNYHYQPVADGLHQFTLHAYSAYFLFFDCRAVWKGCFFSFSSVVG